MDCITGIVLSYNVPNKLVTCIASLLAQPEINEVILIENHSTVLMGDAYNCIRQLCHDSGVSLVFYKPDLSFNFSEGQNWGINHAKNELILLMNNDAVILHADSLRTSIKLLTEDVFVVGHKILNPDGSCNHLGIFFDAITKYTDHLGRNCTSYDYSPKSLLAVTAACVLLRRSEIRFDTQYWFEYEDMDFCLQHIAIGKKIVCNPDMPVVHEESSTRAEPQATNKMWQEKQRIGRAYFYKKWRWFLMLRTCNVFSQWPLLPDNYKAHLRQTIGDVVGAMACVGVLLTVGWNVVGLRWEVVLFQVLALGLVFIGVKALCVFFLKKLT